MTAQDSERTAAPVASGKRGGRRASAADGGVVEHSRERIQRAALTRFARYGYEAVSLQQIADDVGLHKSSLFHHYSSKSELLIEVFGAVIGRVTALLGPLQASGPPSLEAFGAVYESLIDHFCDDPLAARLVLASMTAPDDSEVRDHCGGIADQFYAIVIAYLKRARQSGVIRPINIRQAVPNMIALVLVYPAVAHDLSALVGDEPFSARARRIRKDELMRVFRALFEPG